MKNTVKFLSMMFAVSAMMLVSCTPEPNEPDTPAEPTKYTVQVNCNDATMGTVTIAPQQTTYLEGDTIVITATPNEGYKFLNWNGSITDNPYTYVVKENITFTANFEALPLPTWGVTFDGTALDVAGWYEAQTLPDGSAWLFQCAKQLTEDNRVALPYIVVWMQGNTPNALTVNNRTELYKDEVIRVDEQTQYGDYQFKSLDNMNCTELDLTAYKMSMTAAFTMYHLSELANGTANTADECSTATVAVTLQNMVYTPVEGGKSALKKYTF